MIINVINKTDSVANHFLFELRNRNLQQDRSKFRNNLRRLGFVMGYEISKSFSYELTEVETPLSKAEVMAMSEQPVLIGILRAALPFMQGIVEVFDQCDTGFIGAYREKGTEQVSIKLDYLAVPDLTNKTLILADPMLATGKSIVDAVNRLTTDSELKHLHLVSAVAAPEGIDYISRNLEIDCTLWVGAVDKELNEYAYIVPGLGDAGDLSFGPKV